MFCKNVAIYCHCNSGFILKSLFAALVPHSNVNYLATLGTSIFKKLGMNDNYEQMSNVCSI